MISQTEKVSVLFYIYRIGTDSNGVAFVQLARLGFKEDGDASNPEDYHLQWSRWYGEPMSLVSYYTVMRLKDSYPPDLLVKIKNFFAKGRRNTNPGSVKQVRTWRSLAKNRYQIVNDNAFYQ